MKHLKHLKHIRLQHALFSTMSPCNLEEWKLIITELNAGTEVSSGAWSLPVHQRSGEHCTTWASTLESRMEGRARAAARDMDWEEGCMTGRKVLRLGMERVAWDGGVARLVAARQRGQRGEAARQRIRNFC